MSKDQRKKPALAYFIAKKLIPEIYREELLGDLLEIYEERLNSSGAFIASTMFWIYAIHLVAGFTSVRKNENSKQQLYDQKHV